MEKRKSELALNHDAFMLHAVDFIRDQGEKCWILSLDKTLQACDLKRVGPHGMPTVLSVDALIEILAVNSAGPGLDSSNFAPLLSNIILNQCLPPIDTYTTEDLHWLLSINERAADLPPEETKEIVKEITRARLSGKTIKDSKLQLRVNRMFQEKRQNISQKLEEARERVKKAEREAEKEKALRQERENQIIKMKAEEVIRSEKWKLAKRLAFRTVVVIVITFLLYTFFGLIPKVSQYDYLFSAVPFLLGIFCWTPKPYKDYKKNISKASKATKRDAES